MTEIFSFILPILAGVIAGGITSCNLFTVIKKAYMLNGKMRIIKQNEEFLKTLSVKNEILEEMKEIYDKAKEDALNDFAAELKESLGDSDEEAEKVLVSLKKYNDLLDKGVRFYSSIESSPEIKELLLSSGDPKALTDTIVKNIENKDDKN